MVEEDCLIYGPQLVSILLYFLVRCEFWIFEKGEVWFFSKIKRGGALWKKVRVRNNLEGRPICVNLIRGLLCKNVNHRLGSRGGIKEIMGHPWFDTIHWEDLKNGYCKPPGTVGKIDCLVDANCYWLSYYLSLSLYRPLECWRPVLWGLGVVS